MSWPQLPLRRIFRIVNGGTPTSDEQYWNGDVPWATPIDVGAVDGKYLGSTQRYLTEEGVAVGSRTITACALVLSTRAPIGYVAQTTTKMAFNQGCRGLVATVPADVRYFRYQLLALRGELVSRGAGSTFMELSGDTLASVPVMCPPLDDQHRIADFLDAETARIDRLTDAQLRALDLLEERANGRILEVIGRSRLVVDDGEPVTQLRRVVKKLARPIVPTDEVITAFRDGQVTARSVRRNEGYTVSASLEPQGQGVEIGDIVIHGLDGFAGAIGDSEASGNCSPVYHVCLPTDGGNSAFYGRLLKLLARDDYLALYGASARERAVDFRNWKIFGQAPIPQVEPSIQHEIGNMITKIRPLREEIKRFNERLAERRQALITAAVTGGITV